MAQNKKPKQGKRTRTYSADGMAVSLIVGLILIALGVLLFLSVVLGLKDNTIFTLLRTFCGGAAGALAILVPVIPVWGGVLVIMSTQRKPPLRPFLLGCLMMLLVCSIVTLLTFLQMRDGQQIVTFSLMDTIHRAVLTDNVGDGMTSFLSDAAQMGYSRGVGGGFLGMLPAWPLWKLFGGAFDQGLDGSAIGGGIVAILLTLVTFCLLIRLDVRAISKSMKTRSSDRRARREQQQIEQQKQELIWQQEQAWQQEQLRLKQEQLRQQQYQQQMQMQQQRIQPAPPPQPMPQDPPDPWSSMMPAGTANWNQTQANAQPPLVQKVEPRPKKPAKPQKKPQVGFEPTPEEIGQYDAPQAMPAAQSDTARRKGLFRRDKAEDEQPRRKNVFDRTDADEPQPGEATRPTRPAASRPQSKPLIAQPVNDPDDWASPGDAASWTDDVPESPAAQQASFTQEAPAPQDTPPAAPEKPARRSPFQRPAAEPAAERPAAQPAAKDPLATEAPVREGSFMARLRAAQAAANGQAAPESATAQEPSGPQRKSRKDTPSAWSQPDAPAANASWRTGDDQRPARPTARSAQAAPKKPQAPSWADTPPWEDSPETISAAPAAAVTPVLTRETPDDSMWQPEIRTPPRRQNVAALADGALMETEEERPYLFPPMELLKAPETQKGISGEEDALRSRRLENTLQSFRVPAKVRHITHGPAISRFELELAPGVKVSKVTDLNRNIAMNMEVKSVRIEAPIPGKSLVGVEVPNRERATVTLREVLESEPMRKAVKPLVVALGKDIAGTPIVCDLAKMPHLLIAGATGSGKSVCINTIINSLLYRCSPKEVRLILVDPKVVELQCYNGIPHLLVPVVSDPHKASGALAWAVGEMMDRYKRFQEAGVRAIDGFNEQMPEDEKMPRIVIVIDELADLMMTCKKDVEERICRLAQLARAAGIHLIVATQRPSVDVITGLIKANIPSRIAFKVSSNVDSRTILDRIGAEQLLGYGDMLYAPTGEFTPIRVQGCFLSDPEVNRITDYIRESCPASYDPAVLEELEKLQADSDNVVIPDSSSGDDYTGGDGSLLAQCIEMAVNDGQVSTSLIQRRLKLGYARAGRLVDEMEKRGIVSQKDGAKPRMCLISREEFEMMKDSGALD